MSVTENRMGIKPIRTVKQYELSTYDVRDWMQKRLNSFITLGRQEQMSNDGRTDIPDIKVNVLTYAFSKKFAPFIVMLPPEALKKSGKNQRETMAFFLPDESEELALIIPRVWDAFRSFVYTKDDRKEFLKMDGQLKHELQMSKDDCAHFTKFVVPKLLKPGGSKVIVFLIDPIRVFSEMVREDSEKPKIKPGDKVDPSKIKPDYLINDITFERINSDNYKYIFNKEPKKNGKKNANFNKKIFAAMKRMISD